MLNKCLNIPIFLNGLVNVVDDIKKNQLIEFDNLQLNDATS